MSSIHLKREEGYEKNLYSFLHARRTSFVVLVVRGKTELVHHPIGLGAFPCAASVVDQRFLQANAVVAVGRRVYRPVDARCLPESRASDPVGSYAVPVLSSPQAEEVPFFLATDGASLYLIIKYTSVR